MQQRRFPEYPGSSSVQTVLPWSVCPAERRRWQHRMHVVHHPRYLPLATVSAYVSLLLCTEQTRVYASCTTHQCAAGQYSDDGVCRACGHRNGFQDQSGQTSCKFCPNGKFSLPSLAGARWCSSCHSSQDVMPTMGTSMGTLLRLRHQYCRKASSPVQVVCIYCLRCCLLV